MEQDETAAVITEIKNAIVSGAKFPDVILNMLCDIFGEHCSVILQKFYV
jgi:hypothetical protein